MCDLTPVIEGPVKFRDGKKVREKVGDARSDLSSDVDDECLVSVFSGRRDTPASPVSRRSQVRLDVIVSIAARDSPKDSASRVHTNAHVGL